MKYVRFSFLFLLLSSFHLNLNAMGDIGFVLRNMQKPAQGKYYGEVEKRLKKLQFKKKEDIIQKIVSYRGDDLVQKESHKKISDYRAFKELPGRPEVYRKYKASLTSVYETPLTYAAFMTRTSLFNLLLEYGANLNGANSLGQTPLMVAADVGALDIVDALLQRRVNPNAKAAYSKRTALHYALQGTLNTHKHAIAVKLIKAGAKLTIEDRDFKTPMSEAIRLCNDELVELMLSKELPNRYNVNYRKKSEKKVQVFAEDKKTITSLKTNLGMTALMEALDLLRNAEANELSVKQKKNLKKIALLLAETKELRLDDTDTEGKTALMYAALAEELDVVKALIERGADDKKLTAKEDGQDVYDLVTAYDSGNGVRAYLLEIKKAKEEGKWSKREDLEEVY